MGGSGRYRVAFRSRPVGAWGVGCSRPREVWPFGTRATSARRRLPTSDAPTVGARSCTRICYATGVRPSSHCDLNIRFYICLMSSSVTRLHTKHPQPPFWVLRLRGCVTHPRPSTPLLAVGNFSGPVRLYGFVTRVGGPGSARGESVSGSVGGLDWVLSFSERLGNGGVCILQNDVICGHMVHDDLVCYHLHACDMT